jgi:hypothetical protein
MANATDAPALLILRFMLRDSPDQRDQIGPWTQCKTAVTTRSPTVN